jgi:ribosome recycling factor
MERSSAFRFPRSTKNVASSSRSKVHEIAEEHRIALRNIRHAANDSLKKMLKDKLVSEDDERSGLDEVQKLTNTFVGKIDELAKHKEQDIMSV